MSHRLARCIILVVAVVVSVPLVLSSAVLARPLGPSGSSGPSGIKAAGACTLSVFNLDQSQAATVVVDFYKQGGGAAVPISLPPVLPLAAFDLELAAETRLTNGAYAAIVSSDRDITDLSTCQWAASGGAIMSTDAEPGTRVLVPLVVKRAAGTSSLISIQNTDPNQQAMVTLKLMAADGSTPMTKNYAVDKGSSITLDLGNNVDFQMLPDGFVGALTVESSTPLAVNAIVDYENSERAVMAFEGIPEARAAASLFAPVVANAAPMNPADAGSRLMDSTIAVMNPGVSPVQVTARYRGLGGGSACLGQAFTLGPIPVAPGGNALIHQGAAGFGPPGGPSPIPAGCPASAVIETVGGSVVATVLQETAGHAEAAAYDAVPVSAANNAQHLPLVRRDQDGMTSAIWAMNASAAPIQASLALKLANGTFVAGCGAPCVANIPAWEAHAFWLGDVAAFPTNQRGSGVVTADGPLAVTVNDIPLAGTWDLSSYNGAPAVTGGPVPRARFVPWLLRIGGGARPTAEATATPLLPATPTLVPPPSETPLVTATPFPTATPRSPATSTPFMPSTPTPMATVTSVPATDTPAPTATPIGQAMAPGLAGRVPGSVLADAVANPGRVSGWRQPLDPGKPVGPFNPLRTCLTLQNPNVPWHPLFNTLVYKAGCP